MPDREPDWARGKAVILGQVIAAIRKETAQEDNPTKGWTQGMLAETAGLDPAAISKIESGKSSPTVSTLYRIAEALDVKLEDIFIEARELEAKMLQSSESLEGIDKDALSVGATPNWLKAAGSVAAVGLLTAGVLALTGRGLGVRK